MLVAMTSTKNPFPGMNPWLQRKWSDVHTKLITFIAEALTTELPPDLAAYAEERIALQAEGEQPVGFRSDVAITESWRHGLPPVWTPEHDATPVALAQPMLIRVPERMDRWVEIVDPEDRVITVIEVLSPANKSSDGRATYFSKARGYLNAGINLVEIDLVRGGRHSLQVAESLLPAASGSTQFISVHRTIISDRFEVYPCPLRERLPAIRIPLRPADPDIPLDLQPLVDRCYEMGRYWRSKWQEPLIPPLPDEDAAWAQGCLKSAGLIE